MVLLVRVSDKGSTTASTFLQEKYDLIELDYSEDNLKGRSMQVCNHGVLKSPVAWPARAEENLLLATYTEQLMQIQGRIIWNRLYSNVVFITWEANITPILESREKGKDWR